MVPDVARVLQRAEQQRALPQRGRGGGFPAPKRPFADRKDPLRRLGLRDLSRHPAVDQNCLSGRVRQRRKSLPKAGHPFFRHEKQADPHAALMRVTDQPHSLKHEAFALCPALSGAAEPDIFLDFRVIF